MIHSVSIKDKGMVIEISKREEVDQYEMMVHHIYWYNQEDGEFYMPVLGGTKRAHPLDMVGIDSVTYLKTGRIIINTPHRGGFEFKDKWIMI